MSNLQFLFRAAFASALINNFWDFWDSRFFIHRLVSSSCLFWKILNSFDNPFSDPFSWLKPNLMKYGDSYHVDSLFIMIREDEVAAGDSLERLLATGPASDKGLETLSRKKVLTTVVRRLSEAPPSTVSLSCDCCIVLLQRYLVTWILNSL